MRLNVVIEARFFRDRAGAVYTDSVFDERFWSRYLEVFDEVNVVARVQHCESAPVGALRADRSRVCFSELPYYIGPLQYLRNAPRLRSTIAAAISSGGAVLLRIPSQLGWLAGKHLSTRRQPYAVEVVGDPYDTFSTGATRHILRRLFRWWFVRSTRALCHGAAAASYVTTAALQKRYPPNGRAFTTNYSSIELTDAAIAQSPRAYDAPIRAPRFITVGTLEQLYKGQDVLLRALAMLDRSELAWSLTVVGEGQYRPYLENLTEELGISEHVTFRGRVAAGHEVRQLLDGSDVFVLASRQEGLPRALIEAMARALPCVATTVGGIPELLPENSLVRPGKVPELAAILSELVRSPTRLSEASTRNLEVAKRYRSDLLRTQRQQFYQHLRSLEEGRS